MSIRIAVVGTGSVARNSYLPFLSKQQDVVLTYFSRTRSKAEECAGDFGGRAFDSVKELIADEPDAVLVLTLETQRYEVVRDLLQERPKRLFFEKPLVAQNGQANVCEHDFFKAKDLLQRSKAAGTETAMVFNYRFFDQTLRMKKIITERGFGNLIHASMFVNYACWSHCIDLLHLFGGQASQVSALAGSIEYENAVDVSGSYCLANGATGTILGTSGYNFAFPLYQIVLNFERGTFRFNDLDGPMEVFDNDSRYHETHALIGDHSRWDQYSASFEKSLAAYLDSIRGNVPPPVPGVAGLEELQFEVSLRRSIEQKRPVDVQVEFPIDI
ncbi:MAG: Gfo/Idh/MocA family oxidoreductase [Spirochaetales bacterium]|jgi:predicted dehydrogenase|nr:Gfo/Idh/MocA family oxidoreductase [Spirochaetales bacterium]